jgi:hypothetical protein
MSGTTETIFEEMYSSAQAATTTTPSTSAVSLIAAYPPPIVNSKYMGRLGDESSSLRVILAGQMTATATVPTWKIGLQFTTASTLQTPAAANILGETATFTPVAGTGAYWLSIIDVAVRAVAQGAASTVVTIGKVEGALLPTATFGTASIPATNVAPTNANWDVSQAYYLWPYLTLGAATAGNTISLHMMKIYGEN